MADSQALVLSQKLAGATPHSELKVLIPSALELTPEQEQRMLDHFRQRLQNLEQELGRSDFEGQDWLTAPILDRQQSATSFMGRRHLAHMVAQQKMDWRPTLLGGLYNESNLHLPLTNRIITQQSARAQKSFFGTAPYFNVAGLSGADADLGEDLNAWARHKLETESNVSSDLERAIDLAFIQGECVVKTSKSKLISYFKSWRTVAIDPATKEPFMADDGDYIYDTDVFVPQMQDMIDEATGQPVLDEQGMPMQQETGLMVLKRDMTTVQPAPDMRPLFQTVKLDLAKVLADKVQCKPIYYLDFLCPIETTDVQNGTCIHLYNMQIIEMASKYLTDENFGNAPEEQLARIRKLVADLMPGTNENRLAAADQPRSELSESHTNDITRLEPMVGIAEVWDWYDPYGDGVMRSIMCVMDREGRVPVYYDFVANVTDDGLRPFDVVRINPPAGRWHGQGNVERFWNLQIYTDLLINRSLFAESRAARVDFWNPQLTVEGSRDPALKLNWGATYTLKDATTDPAKVLQPVYLTNIKSQNLQTMLQTVQQMAQNMSGVTNVNDGAMAGMDTAKLATGIKNLENSGEEMFHAYITQLRPCLESILRRALRVVVSDIPRQKAAIQRFFDRPTGKMLSIDPLRLHDLTLDVALSMTTYKGQASLQQAQTAYPIVLQYTSSHPLVQSRLQPIVNQVLKSLEFKDADTVTTPWTMEEWMAMNPPQLPPATGSPSPL